jgi:hypothetical protein
MSKAFKNTSGLNGTAKLTAALTDHMDNSAIFRYLVARGVA